jgi:hypothetical protein
MCALLFDSDGPGGTGGKMHLKNAAVAAVLVAAGVTVTAPTTATADPNIPCWSRQTYISSGGYYNLTYKNCHVQTTMYVKADAPNYPCYLDRKTVPPGSWVSWTYLPIPAGIWYANPYCP